MEAASSSSDAPADPRVEGAIENLNSAIDALNTLEDTRSAAEAAAQRAAAVVKAELAEVAFGEY